MRHLCRAREGGQVRPLNGLGNRRLCSRSTFSFRGLLDQLAHSISRLSALLDPITNAFGLELNLGRLPGWIVRADVFQERAITLRLLFLNYYAIRGSFLCAHAH